jgi:hypothetical protein
MQILQGKMRNEIQDETHDEIVLGLDVEEKDLVAFRLYSTNPQKENMTIDHVQDRNRLVNIFNVNNWGPKADRKAYAVAAFGRDILACVGTEVGDTI